MAFSILGMTYGVSCLSLGKCIKGLLIGGTFTSVFLAFSNNSPTADLMGPHLFHSYSTSNYLCALFGALTGSALQLPVGRLINTAVGGAMFSMGSLVISLGVLRSFNDQFLGVWEWVTMIAVVPVLGIGMWWPVDFINNSPESK